MTGTELALLGFATVVIGAADVFGGLASRRARPLAVGAWSQGAGVPVLALIGLFVGGSFVGREIGIGALAGIGTSVGIGLMYIGFSVAPMGVVAPTVASTAAVIPAAVGIVNGEPFGIATGVGFLMALAAIYLVGYVPGGGAHVMRGLLVAIGSGAGFAWAVIAYSATTEASGVWSAVVGRSVGSLILFAAAYLTARSVVVERPAWSPAAWAAVLGATGFSAYVIAAQTADLVILGIVTGIVPTATAVFAALFVNDKLSVRQWSGVALAAIAVTVISLA